MNTIFSGLSWDLVKSGVLFTFLIKICNLQNRTIQIKSTGKF